MSRLDRITERVRLHLFPKCKMLATGPTMPCEKCGAPCYGKVYYLLEQRSGYECPSCVALPEKKETP